MANENANVGTENSAIENQQNVNQQENNTPTVEELMEQLKQANADRDNAFAERDNAIADKDKFKASSDKLSKELAEKKRAERAKMTTEEQEAEARAENERLKDERIAELESKVNRSDAEKAYRKIPDDKMVESLIDAVLDADHNAIANIMEKYATAKVKEAQAEWLKSRPPVNAGGNGALTKEQFNNMSLQEKSKLYRENRAEYDRLNS